ncbi:MAG: CHASE4 domain-containing protein [Archaeoglobaceae archaeon]
MKAREKLFIIAIPVALLLFLVLSYSTISIERDSTENLAKIYAKEKIEILNKIFDIELHNVEIFCMDWAFWDDTYEFIESRDQEYIISNLGESGFRNSRINLMVFFDDNGSVVYSKFYDANWEEKEIPRLFFSRELINKTGFLEFDGSILAISSKPILKSDLSGEPRGYLLVGRIFDEKWMSEIGGVLNARVLIGQNIPESYGKVITAEFTLRDILGREIDLEIETLNPYYSAHIQNILLFIFSFSVITFSFYLIAIFAVDRSLISRILKLDKFVSSAKPGDKIELKGVEELENHAESITSMLQRVAKDEEEIRFLLRILRHDLANILTTLSMHIDACKTEMSLENLERAEKQLDRAMDIISIIKKLEGGELKAMRIGEVIEKLRDKFPIPIETRGDAEVLADEGIYVVFSNLIENAIRHGKASKVVVEVLKNDKILIKVCDNGKGFSKTAREKVFKEIYTEGGSGVGLFIVKKLVEKYRGRVELIDSNTIAMRFPNPKVAVDSRNTKA